MLQVDQEEDRATKQIGHTARQFCKYMQRNHEFLEFTPSQQAATAIILSLNLCQSPVCESIGLKRIGCGVATDVDSCAESSTNEYDLSSEECFDPLSIWTEQLNSITSLSARDDISIVYSKLITHIDTHHFKGKLAADHKLWIKSAASVRGVQGKILQVTKELVN